MRRRRTAEPNQVASTDDEWVHVRSKRKLFLWIMITTLVIAGGFAIKRRYFSESGERDTVLVIGAGAGGVVAALEAFHRANHPQPVEVATAEPPAPEPAPVLGFRLPWLTGVATAPPLRVVLVEKHVMGGNSQKATSGVNAAGTKWQAALGVADSPSRFVEDIIRSGKGAADERLVQVLAGRSGQTVQRLSEAYGLDMSDVNSLGGHNTPRTHRFPPSEDNPRPFGVNLLRPLMTIVKSKAADEAANFELLEHTRVLDLTFVEKTIDGQPFSFVDKVKIEHVRDKHVEDLPVRAVVIASGGYAGLLSEEGLLRTLRPDLADLPTTNNPTSAGDLQRIAMDKGLEMYQPEKVQIHPTSFIDLKDLRSATKFLCPEIVRSLGGKLMDHAGESFVNEMETRDVVSAAILKRGGLESEWGLTPTGHSSHRQLQSEQSLALLVMDNEMPQRFGTAPFHFYLRRGLIHAVSSADELKTIAPNLAWDAVTKAVAIEALPLYVSFVTPANHYTLGGIHVDDMSRALRDNKPVPNLFVVGEAAGGLHGDNRLGGNGIAEAVVFGSLAGGFAAQVGTELHYWPEAVQSSMTQTELLSKSVSRRTLRVLLPSLNSLPQPGLKIDHLFVEAHHRSSETVEFTALEVMGTSEPGVVELQCEGEFEAVEAGDRVLMHVTVPG